MRPISRSCEGLEGSDQEVEGHSVIIVTQGQFKVVCKIIANNATVFNELFFYRYLCYLDLYIKVFTI